MKLLLAAMSLGLAFAVSPAAASTIVEFNVGTSLNAAAFIGQSVTTTTGGPWDNISFNFFEPDDDPFAVGSLFILDMEYLGTPPDLNSSTSGYLADTSSIVDGAWVFGAELTLQPLTTYYFYATTVIPTSAISGAAPNSYAGGVAYNAFRATNNYAGLAFADWDFRLSGTQVDAAPVPEPASLTLLGIGLVGLGARRWRQRKAS